MKKTMFEIIVGTHRNNDYSFCKTWRFLQKFVHMKMFFVLIIAVLPELFYAQIANSSFLHDFNNPNEDILLTGIIWEVSGIVWLNKDEIACVQDESGKVFIYDIEQKTIERSYTFSSEGDYEGIIFSPKADVFISNEGSDSKPATLLLIAKL